MGLEFAYPWALLALPVCGAAVLWIHGRYRRRGPSLKRRVTLAARLLLVALLSLAMASPSLLTASGAVTRWILLDVSDSARDSRTEMEQAVSDALAALPKGERVGVIAFGNGAMVELAPVAQPVFSGAHTAVKGDGSDLDDALLLANALLPADGAGSLSVLSDGNAAVSAAVGSLIAARGVRVDVLPFQQTEKTDAQLTELRAPAEAYEGQSVTVEAVIDATAAMSGSLALYQNGLLADTRQVTLRKGENRFVFRQQADGAGVVTYQARLLFTDDGQSMNNAASAYVRVSGAPNLLLVSDSAGVAGLLAAAGLKCASVRPEELFLSAEDYLAYDAVVLNNVDFDSATEAQWQALEAAVRTLGRGLVVLGGDQSYALGGYRGTLLEELLPVRIDVRNKLQMPSLSLVIAIDKSGSMTAGQFGTSRIEVAKEAAISALEVLTERDNIGVIGFDEAAKWVVPFQQATDTAAIQSMIGSLRADGGTAFFSALELSLQTLLPAGTAQKHVILLSDGAPADAGFETVVQSMKAAGITLTTVAVGNDADTRLMLRLASLGGGRSYQADEFSNVPKIFAKETMLAGGNYVQNRVFTPVVTENAALTAFEGFPALSGYLAATEKPTATVSMVSDTEDPLLARWNAGAGKVLAWLSDAEGAWTSGFLGWREAPAFFGGMVAAVLPGADREGVLTAQAQDGKIKVVYTLPAGAEQAGAEDGLTTRVTAVAPDGTEETAALAQTGPNAYEGEIAANGQGAYALRAEQADESGVLRTQESGAVVGYAREYDLRNTGDDSLSQLVQRTGGRTLQSVEGFWDTPVEGARARKSLQTPLVLAALTLLLLDIALRKLPWEDGALRLLGKLKRKKGKAAGGTAGATGAGEGQAGEASREARRFAQKKNARPPSQKESERAKREAAANTADALLSAKRARRGE